MMRSLFFRFLALFLFPSSSVYAQAPEQQFAELMASFTSISGSFVQTIYAESGEVIDQQRGVMSLQKPRLIRWETAEPRQVMVCDGDSIYLYDPDLEQVVIRPWRDDPTQNPVSLFTADVALSDWFDISRNGTNFELRPIQSGSLINAIMVYVDDSGMPAGFSVSDQPGQVTEVRFEQVDFDKELATTVFSFRVPDGVDVIVDD